MEEILADVRVKVAEYGLTEQELLGRKRAAREKRSVLAKTANVARYIWLR